MTFTGRLGSLEVWVCEGTLDLRGVFRRQRCACPECSWLYSCSR